MARQPAAEAYPADRDAFGSVAKDLVLSVP